MMNKLTKIGKIKINQYKEGGINEMITGKRKTLNLAIIGTGTHNRNNLLPNLPFLPLNLVCVCSKHYENAVFYGKKYGAGSFYSNYREMLEKEDIDLILCSVGANEHPKIIKEALKKNIPIFVEKPIARTSIEINELLKDTNANKVMVGFQKRFVPNYLVLRDLIENKKYGNLNYLQLEFGVGAFSSSPHEFLLEIGIHFIDLLRYFLPEVRISNVQKCNSKNGRINFSVSFNTKQGSIGHLLLSSNFDWNNCHERVFANFEKTNICIENVVDIKISSNSKTLMKIPLEKVIKKKIYKKNWYPNYISGTHENSSLAQTGFFPELQYFIKSVVKNNKNDISNMKNAYETHLMMEKIINV